MSAWSPFNAQGTNPGIHQCALTEDFLDVKSKAVTRCIEDTFGTGALGDTSRSAVQSSLPTRELTQSRELYILWTVMMQYARETRLVGRCLAPIYHSICLEVGSKGTHNDQRAVSDRKHRGDTTDEASGPSTLQGVVQPIERFCLQPIGFG